MGNNKQLIWIVDDDEGIREVTQIILREMEYDVQSYASCTEVEQALHQSVIPALILLDVRISGARGEDVAKILHANEKTKHVPIITLSAHMDIAEKAKEANAVDYLAKPFDIMQLEHIVKKHIQK